MTLFTAVLVPSVILSGCASARLQQNLDSWIGQPETLLIETYGAPATVYSISPSEKILTYTEDGYTSAPISTYNTVTHATTLGAGSIGTSYSCRVNFTIKSHKVLKYYRQGRGCGFVTAAPKGNDK